ncbi:MAG: hypothetical protein WC326_01045 [Candidatus Delongbacteria bacterium]
MNQPLVRLLLLLLLGAAGRAQVGAEPTPALPAVAVPDSAASAGPVLEPERYPLTRCLITGAPLGSMGEVIQLDLHGLSVQLCCDHCNAEAQEREELFRKTITKALLKRDGPDYPLQDCLACGQALPRKPLPLVQGSTLLLVDTEACAARLAAEGAGWARTVRAARAAASAGR